jgi:hypothetical protein
MKLPVVSLFGKFVILRYDKILHRICKINGEKIQQKSRVQKNVKTILVKKSAKLRALSRAAVGLGF